MDLKEFSQLVSNKSILIAYFSHDDCSVCQVLRPKVENWLREIPQVEFIYINTILNPEISGQYIVFSVPTIIIFIDGREAKRYSRHFSMHDLQTFVERYLEK